MSIFVLMLLVWCSCAALAVRQIKIQNNCNFTIWISPITSDNGAALKGRIQRLTIRSNYTYNIPDAGWIGRFSPKTDCDDRGQNCAVGQSTPPCGRGNCQPPADTKLEFFFPPLPDGRFMFYVSLVYFYINLVDGYSLPAEIIPSQTSGLCARTSCRLSLAKCPTNEVLVGDLRVQKNGRTVQCLAPCEKLESPTRFDRNRNDHYGEGLQLCCPTPPISAQQCRAGILSRTQYVKLIQGDCPTAYSYAYDEKAVLHSCPNPINFVVNFC